MDVGSLPRLQSGCGVFTLQFEPSVNVDIIVQSFVEGDESSLFMGHKQN